MQQKTFFFVALASLVTGLAIFYWGQGAVRNYGGDIIVVIFLYALVSLFTNWQPRTKLLAIGGLAFAVECAQIFIASPGNDLQQATFGAYFDPLDLIMYTLGLLIASSIDSVKPKP